MKAATFNDRLKEAIIISGLTNKDISKKTGISDRTIENWRANNPTTPRADDAATIAQALGTTVEFLAYGEAGMNYVLDWAGRNGARWKPPPRLEAIVAELEAMDDRCLAVASAMMRAAVAEIVRDAEPQPRAENQ